MLSIARHSLFAGFLLDETMPFTMLVLLLSRDLAFSSKMTADASASPCWKCFWLTLDQQGNILASRHCCSRRSESCRRSSRRSHLATLTLARWSSRHHLAGVVVVSPWWCEARRKLSQEALAINSSRRSHTALPDLDGSTSFFGVYDGHGGTSSAAAVPARHRW
ncbi:putative protein phosphatase 2C 70 [Platanthera zijinensis]|uniref:Uncharacterized protein n=1 Tax=Platanthera zijinensis TaxID=2320716 RepID=A0AAP0FZE0_9ASPA